MKVEILVYNIVKKVIETILDKIKDFSKIFFPARLGHEFLQSSRLFQYTTGSLPGFSDIRIQACLGLINYPASRRIIGQYQSTRQKLQLMSNSVQFSKIIK